MITSINNYKENEEREEKIKNAYENLVKDFNLESKKQKSKFRLKQEEKVCLQKISLFMNSLGENNIKYKEDSDTFSFEDGIDEDLFKEVEPILKELKQKFEIEVIEND
jgi:hypothetical protein